MDFRRQGSRLQGLPEVRGTLHISLVWLVFYVVLFGHGLFSHKTAVTGVTSADRATVLLSADRRQPSSAVRGH